MKLTNEERHVYITGSRVSATVELLTRASGDAVCSVHVAAERKLGQQSLRD